MKEEIKKNLTMVVGIIVIIVFAIILNVIENNAVKDCVNAGNSYEYCENGLK